MNETDKIQAKQKNPFRTVSALRKFSGMDAALMLNVFNLAVSLL